VRDQQEHHHEDAAQYARRIVAWHINAGKTEWQRRFGPRQNEGLARYQDALARFQNGNFSDPAVQLAIAREQISGSMEWAYDLTAPEPWPGFEGAQPCLGAIARKLEQLALQAQQREPPPEKRTRVRYSNHQELLAKAQEIYAPVTGPDVQGAGGTSFLLSCSLERAGTTHGEVVLFPPEFLGASPAPRGRPGDVLALLEGENLEILDVRGTSSV
jgi:hypothetical protein